jgi:hypothetical protein
MRISEKCASDPEESHHLLVAILRCHHQRRAAITGFGVYIGLGIEQRPYHLIAAQSGKTG